jgi:Protein of unknown function (DUF2971)
MAKSRSLFHYTTAEGLLGIIKDRCLWATHAEFSNDTSECKLLKSYVAKLITPHIAKLTPTLIEKLYVSESLLKEHGTSIYEDQADEIGQVLLDVTNKVFPYYITSFCIHEEGKDEFKNGLLSQWRGYARGGFAIEFDELELKKLTDRERARWCYEEIFSNNVVYNDHESRIDPLHFKGMAGAFLRAVIEDDIAKLGDLDRDIPGAFKDELDELLGEEKPRDYAIPFLSVATFLKHPDFVEENEYRIVALCYRPNSQRDPGDKRETKTIEFRQRAGGSVTPYIALYKDLGISLPIKSVIVGPHPQQQDQMRAIEMLLEQHNVKADVRISQTPFRG